MAARRQRKTRWPAPWDKLAPEEMQEILRQARRERVARGKIIMHEDEPAASVIGLIEGIAVQFRDGGQQGRQILALRFPGDFLVLAQEGRAAACGVEAVTPARIWRMPQKEFWRSVEDCPALRRIVLMQALRDIDAEREQIVLLREPSAVVRLGRLLILLAGRDKSAATGRRILLHLSRRDIAAFLGLQIETVSRAFTQLRVAGIIDLPRRREVAIRSLERLATLAGVPSGIGPGRCGVG